MNMISDEQKLFRSCEILFGSELTISLEFLDYIQVGGLKDAYRRRAKETHPDAVLGKDSKIRQKNTLNFRMVQDAYENLLCFLKSREKNSIAGQHCFSGRDGDTRHSQAADTGRSSFQADDDGIRINPIIFQEETKREKGGSNLDEFYQGALPERNLLFGHFLYYSGVANWRTITRVLIWQRIERPRIGELGCRFGLLRQKDIPYVLQKTDSTLSFGMAAVKLGLLNIDQVNELIFHQKKLQKKFGRILVEKNLIEENELRVLLRRFRKHNARVTFVTENQKSNFWGRY